MSSFGSSVINKSRKKLAPKAPKQRPAPSDRITIDSVHIASDPTPASTKEPGKGLSDDHHEPNEESNDTDSPITAIADAPQVRADPQQQESERHPKRRRTRAGNDVDGRAVEVVDRAQYEAATQLSVPGVTHETRGNSGDYDAAQNLYELLLSERGDAPPSVNKSNGVAAAPARSEDATRSRLADAAAQKRANAPEVPRRQAAGGTAVSVSKLSRTQQKSSATATEPVDASRKHTTRQGHARGQVDAMNAADRTGQAASARSSGRELRGRAAAASQPESEEQETQVASTERSADSEQRQSAPTETTETGTPQAVPQEKGKRKRAMTPEGAENEVIDPKKMTMFDLTKERKQGKKSKLEAEFQSIDWREVARRRKEAQAQAIAAGERASDLARRQLDEAADDNGAALGPQLRLRNGEIVLDTSSLVVNRHAIPTQVEAAVEESDLTKRVTSQSWLYDNRRDPLDRIYRKSEKWSPEDTEMFYSALKMFGTDFDIISKMFRGRTRRMIKHKFVREERQNEARVKAVLLGEPDPMNLQTYCELTGRREEDYKDPDLLARELKEYEERQRADIERERAEQAEQQRKKQEAAQAKIEAALRRKAGEKVTRKKRKKKDAPKEEAVKGGETGVVAEAAREDGAADGTADAPVPDVVGNIDVPVPSVEA